MVTWADSNSALLDNKTRNNITTKFACSVNDLLGQTVNLMYIPQNNHTN